MTIICLFRAWPYSCIWIRNIGKNFGQPYLSVPGSSWVCPGSGGSRPRPSDTDSGKPAFMSGAPRPASLILSGPSPQTLTLVRRAMFITWPLGCSLLGVCRRVPRYFSAQLGSLGYGPAPGPTWNKSLCHTRPVGGTYDKYGFDRYR